jgi:hypothetical protein
MSTIHSTRPAARTELARPTMATTGIADASERPSDRPRGRIGRLAARIGDAVRAAHQASVPF